MVNGVRLALDVGSVRIGVAKCDAEGLLATPLVTITSGPDAVNEIYELVHEFEAKCVYVGKPISLAGKDTGSTMAALDFARLLAKQLENDAINKQKELEANYQSAIKTADKAFQKKDWNQRTKKHLSMQVISCIHKRK